ncbi:hypothetical protein [Ferrovibrio sp.]|uniref:hypothetical protein n=1 Tax=Ferrovibrio sp. TaxID=1917215 RepID=UPI0035111C26
MDSRKTAATSNRGWQTKMRSLNKTLLLAFALAAGLGGCAAVGPTDDPILRSLTWERYVGGDDLDRGCVAGQPPRYRLVYNAVESEQRRTYDITGVADGGGMLEVRVIGRPNLNDRLNPISLRDPLAPWRGQSALYRLGAGELAGIAAVLEDVGFGARAPDGLFLRGDSFYWTAASCLDGAFHFHAWSREGGADGFDRVTSRLLAALAPFDRTGVAVYQPRELPLPPYSTYFNETAADRSREIPHRFQVGRNGLRYSQGTVN